MSYVRVSILGSLISTEQFSINPTFDPTGEFPGGVNQASLDAAALAIANLVPGTNLLTALSPAGIRTGARVEVRDDVTDGLIGISVQQSASATGGTGSLRLPMQAAIVCSLRTNSPGGSGRGRNYWPALGATLDTQGRLSTPTALGIANDFKTYYAAMASALATNFTGISFNLAVRSKETKSTPHVVRLQVGNVIDTQRRRRDAVPEAYQTVTIP